MSSFKPIDGSKEDFRKYLDRKGVLDAITKVLIKCNSDRPENAIEYLLDNLGEKLKDKDTIARLENELNDARNEIEILKREINALKLGTSSNSDFPSNDCSDEKPPNESAVDTKDPPERSTTAQQVDTGHELKNSNSDDSEAKPSENTKSEPQEAGPQ